LPIPSTPGYATTGLSTAYLPGAPSRTLLHHRFADRRIRSGRNAPAGTEPPLSVVQPLGRGRSVAVLHSSLAHAQPGCLRDVGGSFQAGAVRTGRAQCARPSSRSRRLFSITDSIAEQLTQPTIRPHGAGLRVPRQVPVPNLPACQLAHETGEHRLEVL
jgi:hypothetical protein